MNNAILAVSWFLAKTLNAGIVILAVIEAVLMIMAYNKMILLKKRIDALNGEMPGKQVLRSKKAGIVETEYTVKDLPSAGYTGNGHRSVRSDERKRGLVQRAESL